MGKSDVPETAQEKALADVSIAKWNDHQTRIVPLENKEIELANRSPEAATMKAAGAVNADMQQASSGTQGNPNTGAAVSSTPALSVASKAAQAQVNAAQTVQDQHASALGNIVNMGQGKSAAATAGFETAASNASSQAITNAQINQADNQSYAGAAASLAGTAAYGGVKALTPATKTGV